MERDNQKNCEVVIVGAGPVGLSLALGLARMGREVRVIEKNDTTAEYSRAPAIWPGTQEILEELGIVDIFLEEGIIMDKVELYDVDRDTPLLSIPLYELESVTPYPHLLVLPQSQTEKILLNALGKQPSAEVLFSCEVVELNQDSEKVEVHYRGPNRNARIDAAYVAGCDGAHSTVRDCINATLEGETYNLHAALADVQVENTEDFNSPRLTTSPGPAIGIRMGESLWRMILPFVAKGTLQLKQRVNDAATKLFSSSSWQEVWQSEFRLHRRLSSTFAEGRIVLAGDAAHINSPVGGQGMNVGIQDTSILAGIMDEALNSTENEPFEEYGRERREEIRRGVNRFTDILTGMLLMGEGRMLRPAFMVGNLLLKVPFLRHRILKRLAMLE